MSAESPDSLGPRRGDRGWWVLFLVAWFINLGFSLVGLDHTLISGFEFRQSQTAFTTAHFPPGHFPLAYETPVFGPPWSVPLELPVFEAITATTAHVTGLPLDACGRGVSWAFFQLSLPACFLLLGSLGLRPAARLACLALVLTSPLYLYFSRAFLIESTALCFSVWFLAGFAHWLDQGRMRWLAVAAIAGTLGATVKLTTVVVFGVASVLYAVWTWQRRRTAEAATGRTLLGRSLAAYALPLVLGLTWLAFSTIVRNRNANADILNTHFGYWSFGDLPQRLSATYWIRTTGIWMRGLISEGGLAIAVVLFLLERRRSARWIVLGLFAAFLSGQLIFSNLYQVHDYYFYASGVFLVFALGHLLADADDSPIPQSGRLALTGLVILLQLANYGRDYLPDQWHNRPTTELIDAVRDITKPEDMVVIIGLDWDATVPYYAQRRALMFVNGREWNRPGVKASIDRLDPATVGAVVIVGGLRSDQTFIEQTMSHLDLGAAPLLLSETEQIAIWIPQEKATAARDRLPAHAYATFVVQPERPPGGGARRIGQRAISQSRLFDEMSPRPFEASGPGDFSSSKVGSDLVFNAHAPTQLQFHVPAGARRVDATFGIHVGAYAGKDHTDGVEFVVLLKSPGQPDQVLFRRLLDPFNVVGDQGTQQLTVELPPAAKGDLVFRTGAGPQNSFSFDWAYWGHIDVR